MDIYSDTKEYVVATCVSCISVRAWGMVRDYVNINALYRELVRDGKIKELGNGYYRIFD